MKVEEAAVGTKIRCLANDYPNCHGYKIGDVFKIEIINHLWKEIGFIDNTGDMRNRGDLENFEVIEEPDENEDIANFTQEELESSGCSDYFQALCVEDSINAARVATGGSSPSQYRMSVNLPLSSDRTQFVDVDVEGMDIIDAWQMNGNLKDIQKAILRIGKKEGTTEEYDLNKILFYTLREKKRRGLISHGDFWEKVKLLGLGS